MGGYSAAVGRGELVLTTCTKGLWPKARTGHRLCRSPPDPATLGRPSGGTATPPGLRLRSGVAPFPARLAASERRTAPDFDSLGLPFQFGWRWGIGSPWRCCGEGALTCGPLALHDGSSARNAYGK